MSLLKIICRIAPWVDWPLLSARVEINKYALSNLHSQDAAADFVAKCVDIHSEIVTELGDKEAQARRWESIREMPLQEQPPPPVPKPLISKARQTHCSKSPHVNDVAHFDCKFVDLRIRSHTI